MGHRVEWPPFSREARRKSLAQGMDRNSRSRAKGLVGVRVAAAKLNGQFLRASPPKTVLWERLRASRPKGPERYFVIPEPIRRRRLADDKFLTATGITLCDFGRPPTRLGSSAKTFKRT
jgi:hypothetical protein